MDAQKLTEQQAVEVAQINAAVNAAIALLNNDVTGIYAKSAPFEGSRDIVPGCVVYASGVIIPQGACRLPSDLIHYDDLQVAYNQYIQMVKTARDLARQMIEQSKTKLYYHDGRRFIRIAPKKVIERQSPEI
jgi:hypothetical protein